MTKLLSVILPTYNPNPLRLSKTISGLQNQTLIFDSWELIVIDNNSVPAIEIDLSWHPNSRIVTEEKPGLTYARLKGFEQAKGAVIVMVDDDNILDKDYLKNTLAIFTANPKSGAIGGKSTPSFEEAVPIWLTEFYGNLALRDLGENVIIADWKNEYPWGAPIGAGMGIRKLALQSYLHKIANSNTILSDRTGASLSSGGDNDIVIEILKSGWQVGYYPQLELQHIIPVRRTQVNYLARLLNNTNKSWVQLLASHDISPWGEIAPWSVPFRKIKSWFTYRAWQNKVNYIKWKGACGLYDGLSE
ncbi:MAG TPA: glycosyltransferase [Mucilaginibacter sp.]|nr:glycosyltransferase [Mucilaginibacter sp.]